VTSGPTYRRLYADASRCTDSQRVNLTSPLSSTRTKSTAGKGSATWHSFPRSTAGRPARATG